MTLCLLREEDAEEAHTFPDQDREGWISARWRVNSNASEGWTGVAS
jgi:hypothetical protein